ncbi:DUF1376 domain-containing protein [Psychrobacter sp. I-STPA10]|uniref:DUF1376 domain-containing protein n=1 Tax=Psychrobacter sp. I-STPA10 TaxID=2585769 RepID=UPI0022A8C56D|nr:DUF1376 domain-containing protein [Psychrobacter sp. I-STPA10]
MHSVYHNLRDWDYETKYMTRIEKTIFFDLYSMYLLNEKPIDGSDMSLLERRLSCSSEDEKKALAFVLKDKFKKVGKYFKRSSWDKILKDYKWGNRDKGNTNSNNAGNESNDSRNEPSNESDANYNELYNDNTPMSNAERQRKFRQERQQLIDDLNSVGVDIDSAIGITELRSLHEQHITTTSNNVTPSNESNDSRNEPSNESNGKNDAITINRKPRTVNQEPSVKDSHTQNAREKKITEPVENLETQTNSQPTDTPAQITKAEQIREQHSNDIKHWSPPSVDTMRGELMRAGVMMQLTDDQYAVHVGDFKAHYAEQAHLGKPIISDDNRKCKLRQWLQRAAANQKINQAKQSATIVDWRVGQRPTDGDYGSDLPDVFHPSHSRPTQQQAKADPRTSVMFNGLWFDPLPNMSVKETYEYIDKHQDAGECSDEAYKRLFDELQEAAS